nr:immunoglobulin light chain junction region [Macaca mulatta]
DYFCGLWYNSAYIF